MAFAPPEAKDLMGPLCLSCVLFSFRFIRFSVMLCSAPQGRWPRSLHFLGSCRRASFCVHRGGRWRERQEEGRGQDVGVLFALGSLCVLSVATAPLDGPLAWAQLLPGGPCRGLVPATWSWLLGSANTTSSCFPSIPSQGCISLGGVSPSHWLLSASTAH